jgi:hypothetical protein
MNEDKKLRKNRDGKRYETDHSYFLTDAPKEDLMMDEDTAVNVNNSDRDKG